MELHRSWH